MPFQTDLISYEKKDKFDLLRKINYKGKKIDSDPHPFLKWAGGKRQLISQIHSFLPTTYNKYIEGFLGGGSLLFYLLPNEAIINDINQELVNCYNVIKTDIDSLIDSLNIHKEEYFKRESVEDRKEYYYQIRGLDREESFYKNHSPIERASRTIFLNKTCFNGLYRVNSRGQFNTPFGYYKNPTIFRQDNLFFINQLLKKVIIKCQSFEGILKCAKKDDFVYFDPPYHPISKTASFTSYSKYIFGEEEQIKLAETFSILNKRGCKLMLSNSYCDFTLELYKDFEIKTIDARRSINSNGDKRGKIKEILVINDYEVIGDNRIDA